MPLGDLATWFTGLVTAALFAFTLHAWRVERSRVKLLEARQAEAALRAEAALVAAWLQRVNADIRQRSGLSPEACPDGVWALCLSNQATFGLYDWTVQAVLTAPSLLVEAASKHYGPIGPRGGMLVIPLIKVPSDNTPGVSIQLRFFDEQGLRWTRGDGGLKHEDASTALSGNIRDRRQIADGS
jgi:hypothetical protein